MDSRQKERVQAFVGQTIDEADLLLLMHDVDTSGTVREALVDALQMQGMVCAALTSDEDRKALVDAVARAGKAASGTTLRDGVMSALREDKASPSLAPQAKAPRPAKPLLLLLAAAAAVVIGFMLFGGRGGAEARQIATVIRAGAGFDLVRDDGTSSINSGDTLKSRDLISGTTVSEGLSFAYDDGTDVEVVGRTQVGMRTVDGTKHLHLETGTISLDVEPQPTQKPLLIITPHARCKVIGTSLSVVVNDRQTTLRVTSGVVLFENFLEDKALVEAGQEATMIAGESRIRRQIPKPTIDPAVRDRYQAWQQWGDAFVRDPDVVAYYDFLESSVMTGTLTNKAVNFQPDSLHVRNVDGRIRTCSWSEGRFSGLKRSLLFQDLGFVDLSNDHSLRLRETYLSIFLWFKVSSFTAPRQPLIALGDYAWRIERHEETDQLAFVCHGVREHTTVVSKTTVADEQWHLIVGSYDGTALKLYLDGELDAEVPANGYIRAKGGTAGTHVLVGANSDVPHIDYQGWIDEIGILQRPMSAKEVRELYELGRPD